MKRLQKLMLMLLGLGMLCGCMRPIATMGLMIPGSGDADTAKIVPVTKGVEASDGRLWFLFIPLDNGPSIDEAAGRVLQDGKGDVLREVHIYSNWWSLLLFSYDSYTVRADVGDSGSATIRERRVIER